MMHSIRLASLVLTFVAASGTLLKTGIAPVSAQRSPLPQVAFSSRVHLPQWQPLGDSGPRDGGYLYRFQRGDKVLEIRMQEINVFSGNSNRFLRDAAIARSFDPQQPQIRSQPEGGTYALMYDSQATRLTTCLVPSGQSLGRYDDYLRYSHRQQLQPRQLAAWLAGTGPMRDARCLWITLSLPQDGTPPEAVYPLLEEVWRDWFPQWQRAFNP